MKFSIFSTVAVFSLATADSSFEIPSNCGIECSKTTAAVLSGSACFNYRKMGPAPTVGDACTKGFNEAMKARCEAICQGEISTFESNDRFNNDLNSACAVARQTQPRPTIYESCDAGFRGGWEGIYQKFLPRLMHFSEHGEYPELVIPSRRGRKGRGKTSTTALDLDLAEAQKKVDEKLLAQRIAEEDARQAAAQLEAAEAAKKAEQLRVEQQEAAALRAEQEAAAREVPAEPVVETKGETAYLHIPIEVNGANVDLILSEDEDIEIAVNKFCAAHLSSMGDKCQESIYPKIEAEIMGMEELTSTE